MTGVRSAQAALQAAQSLFNNTYSLICGAATQSPAPFLFRERRFYEN